MPVTKKAFSQSEFDAAIATGRWEPSRDGRKLTLWRVEDRKAWRTAPSIVELEKANGEWEKAAANGKVSPADMVRNQAANWQRFRREMPLFLAADELPAETTREKFERLMLGSDELEDLPDPEPLISQLLYVDSTAWLYGSPASGKTFLSLDWACSIAAGCLIWDGFEIKSGPVLYVAGEGVRGIRKRVRAWEKANGRTTAPNLKLFPQAVQLVSDDEHDALVHIATKIGAVLVVLDTQARMSVGLNENDVKDMGMFVDRAEKLREATGACVLTVHHTRKDGAGYRGSSVIEGAATTMIEMTGKEKEPRVMKVRKQKEAEELYETLSFRITDVDDTGSAVLTRDNAVLQSPEEKALTVLLVAGRQDDSVRAAKAWSDRESKDLGKRAIEGALRLWREADEEQRGKYRAAAGLETLL